MALDLKLPLLGDIMTEGTVTAWLCEDGAQVESGQPLYRLETDKVTLDIEAPGAGRLRQLVAAGSDVAVGALVGRLLQPGEEMAEAAGGAASGSTGAAAASRAAEPVRPQPSAGEELRATPAARRLAREAGTDLAAVAAASSSATIREEDVRAFLERQR